MPFFLGLVRFQLTQPFLVIMRNILRGLGLLLTYYIGRDERTPQGNALGPLEAVEEVGTKPTDSVLRHCLMVLSAFSPKKQGNCYRPYKGGSQILWVVKITITLRKEVIRNGSCYYNHHTTV